MSFPSFLLSVPQFFCQSLLWVETFSTLYFVGLQEKCLFALHHGALAPYLFPSLLVTLCFVLMLLSLLLKSLPGFLQLQLYSGVISPFTSSSFLLIHSVVNRKSLSKQCSFILLTHMLLKAISHILTYTVILYVVKKLPNKYVFIWTSLHQKYKLPLKIEVKFLA